MKFTSIIGAATVVAATLVAAQSAHAAVFPDLSISESQTTAYPPSNGDYLNFHNTSMNSVIIDLTVSGGAGGTGTQDLMAIIPGGSDSYFLGSKVGGPGTEETATFSYELYGSKTVYSGTATDILGYGSASMGSNGVAISPGAVPEPATWAMMLLGFGMVGSALRTRRRQTVGFANA